MAARFIPPEIPDNPNGWGPYSVPNEFQEIPYQPFAKSDRLGKIADWNAVGTSQDKKTKDKYAAHFGAGGSAYSYYHDQDDTFKLVDTNTRKDKHGHRRYMYNRQRYNRRQVYNTHGNRDRDNRQRKKQKHYYSYGRGHHQQPQAKHRTASVEVLYNWKEFDEISFAQLSKLNLPDVGQPEDLYCCGSMEYYDKSYDRVNVRNEKPLLPVNRTFHKVTTTDDPIIRKLTSKGNVFATDAIIATLMTCSRSVYPWDIVAHRVRDKLFLDKRDDSGFDLLTVNETSYDPPPDDEDGINSAQSLALEATIINQHFSQQVLKKGERFEFDKPNPFVQEEEDSDVASVGYRYRKWVLKKDDAAAIELIVRCEHDAVWVTASSEPTFMNIKALNEYDPQFSKIDWRKKLDTQRGAVLAAELKNNSYKLTKWTASAILAGSQILKFGYVSRVNPASTSKHVVLGTQQYSSVEFASQINLQMDNAWGILRVIIDTLMSYSEGKYVILKDPNKPMIRLYSVPENTFEDEDGDDYSENEDDDDEEDDDDDDGEKK
ncbi:Eukaryotic translation initiation factor 3 subunit D [Trichoplax sp. H2]|nr:Eukaryotic translation initiation factor 3 subunit D [Trichoplax sp. H2]|eukprot:RDD37503.1 Eukaryotic translation initiation factor 3 subunit D [Trichoplax sp. H2]